MGSSLCRDSTDRQFSFATAAATAAAVAGSAGQHAVPSPRRRFPRVSASPRCPATIPEHPDEELWVDGPQSGVIGAAADEAAEPRTGCRRKCNTGVGSSHSLSGRSTPTAELWVDGPAEFRTQTSSRRKAGGTDDVAISSTAPQPSRAGEATSKLRLPKSAVAKNHSSPQLRHSHRQPVLDGRITAWVKSVQEANQRSGADAQQKPDAAVLTELPEIESGQMEDDKSGEVLDKEETSSMVASVQSEYERRVDESLETASLCGFAVTSSDEDPVPDSKFAFDRVREGVPDGCADATPFSEGRCAAAAEDISPSKISADCVSNVPASPSPGGKPSRDEPEAASKSSRRGGTSPSLSQRSSSVPRRFSFSSTKNSRSHGSQSPEPLRLRYASAAAKTSTPTSLRRCSERSQPPSATRLSGTGAELGKVAASGRSQSGKPPPPPPASKTGSPRIRAASEHCRPSNSAPRLSTDCASVASTSLDGRRLVSPYHTVTSPRRRVTGCSTSSDNSSLLSDGVTCRSKTSEVELSSGYESMLLRDDSDEAITGNCTDWTRDVAAKQTSGKFIYIFFIYYIFHFLAHVLLVKYAVSVFHPITPSVFLS